MCMQSAWGDMGGTEMTVKTREKGDRGFQNECLDTSLGGQDKGIDTAGCKTTMKVASCCRAAEYKYR